MKIKIIRTALIEDVWRKPGLELDLPKEVAIPLISIGKAEEIKKVEKDAGRKRG